MKDRIEIARDCAVTAGEQVRKLLKECREHEGREWVHAQIDLEYAAHHIDKAEGFINRLLVNGKKPWD